MISIVTLTTTIMSTVTTATSLVSGFGLIATITLIALLIAKELAGATLAGAASAPEHTLPGVLDRVLNVAIIPLSMVFVSIVFVKILNVL